jgi:hypothetical protein
MEGLEFRRKKGVDERDTVKSTDCKKRSKWEGKKENEGWMEDEAAIYYGTQGRRTNYAGHW